MKKSYLIISLVMVFGLLTYGFFTMQNRMEIVDDLTAQINHLQLQMNRTILESEEFEELTDEERERIDEAFQNIINARRDQVSVLLDLGLISEEEAEYKNEHLNLMERYKTDYMPPVPGQGMGHRMMFRTRE